MVLYEEVTEDNLSSNPSACPIQLISQRCESLEFTLCTAECNDTRLLHVTPKRSLTYTPHQLKPESLPSKFGRQEEVTEALWSNDVACK